MRINMESYELSLWSRQDEFLTFLRVPTDEFEGQVYNVKLTKNLNGFKSLEFSVPMYIFDNAIGKHIKNTRWENILNEQKVRLKINPNEESEEIYEFILQTFTETRSGLEKVASCVCQDLAVYELSKIGWGITLSESTVTTKEINEFSNIDNSKVITIDYWLDKIFYLYSKLGRVDTTNNDDLNKLAIAITPRDSDGYATDELNDPIVLTNEMKTKYSNPSGWSWIINTDDNKLYEEVEPADYWKVSEIEWAPVSWQFNTLLSEEKQLRYHPITEDDIELGWEYSLEEKKRIISIERSNIYNIVQELAEKFEFWPTFQYAYDSSGAITNRTIVINTQVIEDANNFEIRFGVNLNNISRTIESGSIVTKMFVPPINSSSIDGKTISIADATSNYMRELYLLNFDYYLNSGLLNETDRINISNFQQEIRNLNIDIEQKQNELFPLSDKIDELNSELDIEKVSIDAYNEEILNLQSKKDAINSDDLIIESWNLTNTIASDYIGEYKTIANNYIKMNQNGVLGHTQIYFNGEYISFPPRYFNRVGVWDKSTVTEADFTIIPNGNLVYSTEEGMSGIVVGINTTGLLDIQGNQIESAIRLRYEYVPFYWYDVLQQNLINKRDIARGNVINLTTQVENIEIVIETKTLELNGLIAAKNDKIQIFERDYKYFIKEGQWEDNDYNTYTKIISSLSSNWNIQTSVGVALSEYPLDDTNKFEHYLNIPMTADLTSLSITTDNDVELTFIADTNLFYGKDNNVEYFIYATLSQYITEATQVVLKYTDLSTGQFMTSNATFNNIAVNNPLIYTKTAEIIDSNLIYSTLQIFYKNDNLELTLYEDFDYELKTIEGIDNTYYNAVIVTFKTTNNSYRITNRDNFYYKYEQDITSKFFYNDALMTIKAASVPDVSYTIDIVNISGIPGYEDFKPQVGMIVPIYDEEMLFNGFDGFLTEITYDLDVPEDTQITISSYKNKFADLFQRIAATTDTINYKEEDLYRAAAAFDANGSMTQDAWYKSFLKNKVDMPLGTNNEVIINEEGITLTDVGQLINGVSPLVKMIGQGIYLSNEELNNERIWRTGITANGINASEINTGNLNVKNLMIWNEDQYRFLWDADGIKAFGEFGDGTTDYDTYVKLNHRGLSFNYKGILGSEDASVVRLDWTGLKITSQDGAVELNSQQGLLVNDSLGSNRIQLGRLDGEDSLYGLRLKSVEGDTVMQTDTAGDLWLSRFLKVGGTDSSQALVGLYGGDSETYRYSDGIIRIWAGEGIKYSFDNAATIAINPTDDANKVAFSKDNNFIAVGHMGYPYLTLYHKDLTNFTELPDLSDLPTGTVNGIAWSNDSNYLAVVFDVAPFLIIYVRSGDTLIKINTIDVLPIGKCISVCWNADNTMLAIGTAYDESIILYSNTLGTFAKIDKIDILPSYSIYDCCFSDNGLNFAVVHDGYPYVSFYDIDINDNFIKQPNVANPPSSVGYSCTFSANSNYFNIGHKQYPYITNYRKSGSTFIQMPIPDVLPSGRVNDCTYSADSSYLALAHDYYPYITIYQRSGETFTVVTDVDIKPTGEAMGCSFSNNFNHLVVVHKNTPYIQMYDIEISNGTINGPTFFVTDTGLLYAKNADIEGNIKALTGHIGSWVINNNYLSGNNTGLIANDISGNNLAIWAGSNYANRNNSPFRVYNDGSVVAENIDIEGGSLNIGNNFSVTNNGILTAVNGNFTGDITGSNIIGGSLHITTDDNVANIYLNPIDGLKITSKYEDTGETFTALQMNPSGGMIARELTIMSRDGESLLLNEYGYDTAKLEWFKNMIWNSSFEVLEDGTPMYWVNGMTEVNASIYGSRSLKIMPNATTRTSTVTGDVNIYELRPEFLANDQFTDEYVKIRVSFYRKMGQAQVKLYLNSVNSGTTFEDLILFRDSDTENGSNTLTYDHINNWLDSRCSFYTFVSAEKFNSFRLVLSFTNTHATEPLYIDGVQLEPDKTGMWPSIYQDGPHSAAGFNSTDAMNNIWIGTQAEYNSLTIKKDYLYFITT